MEERLYLSLDHRSSLTYSLSLGILPFLSASEVISEEGHIYKGGALNWSFHYISNFYNFNLLDKKQEKEEKYKRYSSLLQ
jgi:hypothetical protein